jgi:protein-L-isoaspartate(D-aspartate) O-methyltransferase
MGFIGFIGSTSDVSLLALSFCYATQPAKLSMPWRKSACRHHGPQAQQLAGFQRGQPLQMSLPLSARTAATRTTLAKEATMTPSDKQAKPHMDRFLDMLDVAFRRQGVPEGLPPRFREAVAATPRHRFVHRFRIDGGPLRDSGADPAQDLPAIYSDAVMRHVDAAGGLLPSSNSQPSYMMHLLHLLGLERGQAVLEIGSGSGWLAAVMARLVGPEGRVTGIELIPDLAAQSRADLAATGVGNVQIITGDGTRGHAAGAPYDRAIVTAAAWDVPAALLDQVAEGGRALVPIELRGGDGCEVTVLRRQGGALVGERAVPGWFVPLLGGGQNRGVVTPDSVPRGEETTRFALPLGLPGEGGPAPIAAQFRAFLGRTEPGFVASSPGEDGDWHSGGPVPPFGLADEADGSVALWQAGEAVGYGGRTAASRLARAYARWAALGFPGMGAFQLEVHRAGAAPARTDQLWVELRGETALVWRLRPEVGNWRDLAGTDEGIPAGPT